MNPYCLFPGDYLPPSLNFFFFFSLPFMRLNSWVYCRHHFILSMKKPILPSRQKHKPLFIISKVSMFTSRVCSSIFFIALTAVNWNGSSLLESRKHFFTDLFQLYFFLSREDESLSNCLIILTQVTGQIRKIFEFNVEERNLASG